MNIDLSNYNKKTEKEQFKSNDRTSRDNTISEILNKEILFFGNRLSTKKKEAFYMELQILLQAGLDINTSLEIITENEKGTKGKNIFIKIKTALVSGKSLSEAMDQVNCFSKYEIFSIRIAEESGQLVKVLAQLADYYSKQQQYRRLLISALSYPLIVISTAILALLFLLNFLVPLFGDIYLRLGQELPAITQWIIYFSKISSRYALYVFSLLLVLFIFFFLKRKEKWFRYWSSFLVLKSPIFGNLIQRVYLARFAQAMSFLLQSKVPLIQSIKLTSKMISFYPLEHSLTKIQDDILKGTPLYESLQSFHIYPSRMIALIKVGEESGCLDHLFSKVAKQFQEETEQFTKMLGSLIEPVLIIFLAVVVGFVLISMYLPIFKLTTSLGF